MTKNFDNVKKIFQLRTYFPKGIMARMLILVILPIVLSQILTGYMFYRRHWKSISNQSAITFVGNVLTIIDLKKQDKTEDEFLETQQMAKKNFMMDVEWLPGEKMKPEKNSSRVNKLSLRYVYGFLNQNLKKPYSLYADEEKNILEMQIQYPNGVLFISSSLKSVFSKTIYIFFSWVLGSTLIFILIAVPFAKKQVESIKNLTRAISLVGKGEELNDFTPSGSIQVKRAGATFLKTYKRMQRYMKLEFCDDKNLQFALLSDIEDMEKMINSYLSFAKGMDPEKSKKTNITKTIQNLIRKLNKGNYDITFLPKKDYFAVVRLSAFERAVSNVIVNAIRYGKKKIIVDIVKKSESLEISIEDNGPGIPENQREEMFKPFTRLDDSRNTETGGMGLGLSIVQEVIHQHGGEVSLLTSEKLGGLKVKIELPLK